MEIPQLLLDKVLMSQLCRSRRIPSAVVEETVEISQLPLLRKSSFPGGTGQVVDMPVGVSRQVFVVTVQQVWRSSQLAFIDEGSAHGRDELMG